MADERFTTVNEERFFLGRPWRLYGDQITGQAAADLDKLTDAEIYALSLVHGLPRDPKVEAKLVDEDT